MTETPRFSSIRDRCRSVQHLVLGGHAPARQPVPGMTKKRADAEAFERFGAAHSKSCVGRSAAAPSRVGGQSELAAKLDAVCIYKEKIRKILRSNFKRLGSNHILRAKIYCEYRRMIF
jgi:hypothetical protein